MNNKAVKIVHSSLSLEELSAGNIFPIGAENTAYAAYFDGKSYLDMR